MNKKRFTFLTVVVTVLMILSLSIFVACDKAAPSQDKTPDPIKPTEGLIISNSDFKVVGDGEYPKSVNNWTGGRTYSQGSYPSDVVSGAINLVESEYNKNKSKWKDDDNTIYNKLKTHLDTADNAVNNILGIYMPEQPTESKYKQGPTAYAYTSPTFTLDKDSYYKVSVDVLTHDLKANQTFKDQADKDKAEASKGVNIYLSSSTYQEFEKINTNSEWKTFTFFVETSPVSSATLSLRLSLGNASNEDSQYGLTTGYAFFDNIAVEKVEDIEGKSTARAQYYDALKNAQDNEWSNENNGVYVKAASLNVPNQYFDFGSNSVNSSSAPSGWSIVTGNSGKSDSAPHTSYSRNGIIDINKLQDNATSYGTTIYKKTGEGSDGIVQVLTGDLLKANKGALQTNIKNGYVSKGNNDDNVYMLSSSYMSAIGLKLGSKLQIMKKEEYKLSISLFTYNIWGDGVTLQLKSADGPTIAIEGISRNVRNEETLDPQQNIIIADETSLGASTGKWETYDFYIQGNQYKDYAYDLTLWLGTEGTSKNKEIKYKRYTSTSNTSGTDDITYSSKGTFTSGWAFFDNIEFKNVTGESGVTFPEIPAETQKEFTTTDKQIIVNLGTKNKFENIFDTAAVGTADNNKPAYTDKGLPTFWTVEDKIKENPAITTTGTAFLGQLDLNPTASNVEGVPTLIKPVAPYDISDTRAIFMSLSEPSTIGIHSNNLTIEANKSYRISMWVKTQFVNPNSGLYVYLMDASKEGEDPISAINFDKINTASVKDYNGWQELTFMIRGNQFENKNVFLKATLGTGDRFATSTLTIGTAFITNMSWTEISYDNYKDTSTGTYVKSKDFSTTPMGSSFTNGRFDAFDQSDENLYNGQANYTARIPSNFKASDKIEGDLKAGVIDISKPFENSQFKELFGDSTGETYKKFAHDSFKNVLTIGYANDKEGVFNYESDSFTLSKESKYQVSVWVNVQGVEAANTGAIVSLVGESIPNGKITFNNIRFNTWTQLSFYVKTSIFDSSLKIKLGLGEKDVLIGDKKQDMPSKGIVAFDTITLKKYADDESFPPENEEFEDSDEQKYLGLATDSFDASGDFEKGLVSPSNWSGSADTNQTKDNTIGGIIDPVKATYVQDGKHIDFLGNQNLKREDIEKPSTDDVDKKYEEFKVATGYNKSDSSKYKVPAEDNYFNGEPFNVSTYGETSEEIVKQDIFEYIITKKFEDLTNTAKITLDELQSNGIKKDKFLVINNLKDSAYTYSSPSYTFAAGKYYSISVSVRTFGIEINEEKADNGVYIELYLGNANKADDPFIFEAIKTNGAPDSENVLGTWETYTFLIDVQEETISNAKLKLSLGKYKSASNKTSLTSGYAFFDDITVKQLTSEEYTEQKGKTNTKDRTVETITSGGSSEPPTTTNPGKHFDLENLAWMIPTIVLALLTIIVVIVFAIKKIKRPKKASQSIEDSQVDKTNENIVEKKNRYDDNME